MLRHRTLNIGLWSKSWLSEWMKFSLVPPPPIGVTAVQSAHMWPDISSISFIVQYIAVGFLGFENCQTKVPSESTCINIHSSPKETQLFCSCLSFGEKCRSVNFRPSLISTIFLVTICHKTHFSTGSFACYSQEHFGWWRWPGVTDPCPGSP